MININSIQSLYVTALGEVNEEFYTGQRLPLLQRREPSLPIRPPSASTSTRPSTLSTPPSSRHQPAPQSTNQRCQSNDPLDTQSGWICNMCTFQNHPLLNKCEQCDMPLLSAGNSSATNGFVATTTDHRQAYQLPSHLRALPTAAYPLYPPNYHQQSPTRIHIPYQTQGPVTVATTGRMPIVYALHKHHLNSEQ